MLSSITHYGYYTRDVCVWGGSLSSHASEKVINWINQWGRNKVWNKVTNHLTKQTNEQSSELVFGFVQQKPSISQKVHFVVVFFFHFQPEEE